MIKPIALKPIAIKPIAFLKSSLWSSSWLVKLPIKTIIFVSFNCLDASIYHFTFCSIQIYECDVLSLQFFSENFLQVKVFYEQLNYEKVTERISYEVNIVSKLQ